MVSNRSCGAWVLACAVSDCFTRCRLFCLHLSLYRSFFNKTYSYRHSVVCCAHYIMTLILHLPLYFWPQLHWHLVILYKWLQVSQGCSAVVPRRWPLPDGRCRGSTSSMFGLVTISGCAPYAAVDVRRPSFPGCRLSSLEQSATPRHICTVTLFSAVVWRAISSYAVFLILLCLQSDTRHYRHVNRCFYLLTIMWFLWH